MKVDTVWRATVQVWKALCCFLLRHRWGYVIQWEREARHGKKHDHVRVPVAVECLRCHAHAQQWGYLEFKEKQWRGQVTKALRRRLH